MVFRPMLVRDEVFISLSQNGKKDNTIRVKKKFFSQIYSILLSYKYDLPSILILKMVLSRDADRGQLF